MSRCCHSDHMSVQNIGDYVIVNMIVDITVSYSQNAVSLSTCQTVCNYIIGLGVVILSICHSVCHCIIVQIRVLLGV